MGTTPGIDSSPSKQYARARRAAKHAILDEFVAVTGYHRKRAIRLLGETAQNECADGAENAFIEAVAKALIVLWETSDRLCSKRLNES